MIMMPHNDDDLCYGICFLFVPYARLLVVLTVAMDVLGPRMRKASRSTGDHPISEWWDPQAAR